MEFSYPELVPGHPNECPPGWKYLPTLALPDGSHNYDDDTVFFHLPSLTKPQQTIYGISCFRQIPVEVNQIKNLACLYIIQFIFHLENQKSYLGYYKRHCTEICLCAKQDSFVWTNTG